MNSDQVGGIIRAIMATMSGMAITWGFSSEGWVAVTGGIVAVVVALWSHYSNSLPAMISSVAEAPEVKKIYTTPSVAISVPSSKVVATP